MRSPRTGAEQLWYSSMANMKFSLKIVDARGVVGNLGRLFGIGVKAGPWRERRCKSLLLAGRTFRQKWLFFLMSFLFVSKVRLF
jgi:hypothetical protein